MCYREYQSTCCTGDDRGSYPECHSPLWLNGPAWQGLHQFSFSGMDMVALREGHVGYFIN
jgi:hypothetical protein